MGMIKAVVWEHSDGRLSISTDVWPGDETVDIPPKIYDSYIDALENLNKVENVIRMFSRAQERDHADKYDDGDKVLRYKI